jgi:hypothetical protein
MTFNKNTFGFSAPIEFFRVGRAAVLPDGGFPDIFRDAAEDQVPVVTLQEQQINPTDNVKTSDLIFCERAELEPIVEDCPTCVKNPIAFVPDWRTLDFGETFFDERECRYSVVVDTQVTGIPNDVLRTVKIREGIRTLLAAYQKSEITTTVYYVVTGKNDEDRPDPDFISGVEFDEKRQQLNFDVESFENVGANLDTLLNGTLTNTNVPAPRNGYVRLMLESDTIEVLLDTLTKNGAPSVTIAYDVSPIEILTTKALVSIDAEVFRRIPAKIITQPAIVRNLDESDNIIETTLNGTNIFEDFREVRKGLKRANRYATNAIKGAEDRGRFYLADGRSENPVVIDFSEEADKLQNFANNILFPAIRTVLGIRIRGDLEKVRITFERNSEDNTLKIIEVVANRIGCEEVAFSTLRDVYPIVRELFGNPDTSDFGRSTTLGYVAALPDMVFYLAGIQGIVWLEFITQFTYPKLEFRTPVDLLTLEDDRSPAECAAQQSANEILNRIILEGLGAPDLLLDGLVDSICAAAADVTEARLERERLIREQLGEQNTVAIRKKIKNKKKEIRNARKNSEPTEKLTEELEGFQTQLETAQKRQNAINEQNLESFKSRKKFVDDFQEKLEGTTQELSSRPLARALLEALIYGVETASSNSGLSKKEKKAEFKNKLYDINLLQRAIDQTTGGWCGILQLVFEAMQCLLNGLNPAEVKAKLIEIALGSLKPHMVRNFLRAIGTQSPQKLDEFNSRFQEFTGKTIDSLLDPFVDNSQSSVFNYREENQKEATALLKQDLENGETREFKEVKKQARKNVRERRRENLTSPSLDLTEPLAEGIDLATDLLPDGVNELTDQLLGAGSIETGNDLINAFTKILKEIFDIDELFELCTDVLPGFDVIEKLVKDLQCIIPKLPDLDPPLGLNLKSLNLDICKLSPTGKTDFTFPRFNPPLGLQKEKILTDIKNFFVLLGKYLLDLLVDIATQILIRTLVTIIEAVLDLACDLLATAGTAIADAITGNDALKSDLKTALCATDNLSDEQFADAMRNVFGALGSTQPGQGCVQNLTTQEMLTFMDSIFVSVSYNELYNLLLGNPNPNTLTIISRLANLSGSPCIAEIFGNEDNITSYFSGLGTLIDAKDVLDGIPADVNLQDGFNVCRAEDQDVRRQLQAQLYRNKGLTPEQIEDQLEFLKNSAVSKMQDLASILFDGPYKDLPSLLASANCPDNGLLRRDPAIAQGLQTITDATLDSIEQTLIRDLVGVRGLFPRILSDTQGRGLRGHKFLVRAFGNPQGFNNRIFEFYSDDAIAREGSFGPNGPRIDQFGQEYKTTGSLTIISPMGGFPPTVGGYLYHKLRNYRIGPVIEGTSNNSMIEFKTRLKDLELQERNEVVAKQNLDIIKRRKFFLAKWAAATSFVDYPTIQPFLEGDLGTVEILSIPLENISANTTVFDLEKIEVELKVDLSLTSKARINVNSQFLNPSIEKRRAIFVDMINACDAQIFYLPGNKTNKSEERAKRILSGGPDLKNLNINGRIVGMSLADFRDRIQKKKFDTQLDNGELEFINDQNKAYKDFWNINLARKFQMTPELAKLYREMAEQTLEDQLTPPELDNPYELALEFIPYSKKDKDDAPIDPDFKASITYNVNPQDADGNFLEEKYKYRFMYTNTYNPYGADYKPPAVTLNDAKNAPGNIPIDYGSLLPAPDAAQDIVYMGEITSVPSDEVKAYVDQYIGYITNDQVKFSYETEFLRTWLASNVNATNPRIAKSNKYYNNVKGLYDFINQGFFRRISRKIAVSDSGISQGFLFGYDALKQPEAIVLDPAQYGGTTFNPPFYLEPPKYEGWLGVLQKFIPQDEGCDPRRIPLYEMRDIQESSEVLYSQLITDERLNFEPVCTKESPYDTIRAKSNVVCLDNIIRATTRTFIIDFLVKIIPVISQFDLNFDNNFENLLELYLGDYVLDRVRDRGVTTRRPRILSDIQNIDTFDDFGNVIGSFRRVNFFVSKDRVKVNKYYLNFLEAAVSNILIKVKSGIINPETDMNEDQRNALGIIQQTIREYYETYEGTEATLSEEAIQYQSFIKRAVNPARNENSNLGRGSASFNKRKAKRVKVGLLYETILETEEPAKILFSMYIKSEIEALRDRLNNALEPSVDDLRLMIISDPSFVNGHVRKRSLDRGVAFPNSEGAEIEYSNSIVTNTDTLFEQAITDLSTEQLDEIPLFATRPDGTIEYEVPFDVPYLDGNGDLRSNISFNEAFSDIDGAGLPRDEGWYSEWPFVLEKYIRIEDIEDIKDIPETVRDKIVSRPDSLRGIVRISDWIEYLASLPQSIKENKIYDYWKQWYFGLRVSIALNPADESMAQNLIDRGIDINSASKVVTLDDGSERLIIPLAAGELEVMNQLISESVSLTDVVGQVKDFELERQYDTLCLVNELVKTVEFNTFFEYLFPLRRYLSILTIYVSNAFYLSIGNSGALPLPTEDDYETKQAGDLWNVPEGTPTSGFRLWDKNDGNFRKSQRLLKGLFMDLYNTLNEQSQDNRRRARNRDKDKYDSTLKSLLADLVPNDMLAGMPWWQRKMRVDKPFDLFDGECQDEEDYF